MHQRPSTRSYANHGKAVLLGLLALSALLMVLAGGTSLAAADGQQQEPPPSRTTGRATLPDVQLSLSSSDPEPGVGLEFSITVNAYNNSDVPTSGLQVTVTLPPDVAPTATPAQAGSGTYNPVTGVWTVDVGADGGDSLTIYVSVSSLGAKVIHAEVTAQPSGDSDSNAANCPAGAPDVAEDDCVRTTVTGVDPTKADVSLSLTANLEAPVVGGYLIYSLNFRNSGPLNSTGARVQVTVPAALTFVSAVGQGAYDSATHIWDPPTTGNDGSTQIYLTFVVAAPGPIALKLEVIAAGQPDPDSTPNNNNPGEDDQTISILTAAAANPNAIRVGGIPDRRFESSWTIDGSSLNNTRAKLQNPANFGAAGTVARPVQISTSRAEVGQVTVAELQKFDVFIIGYLYDGSTNKFTAAELQAMRAWVAQGGRLIISCDATGYAEVCRAFGHNPSTNSANPHTTTAAGQAHPIFAAAAPFSGGVALPGLAVSGAHATFPETDGATVLAVDATSKAIFIERQDVGCGLAVLFADIDIIAVTLTSTAAITNNNDKLLGNMIAWMGNARRASASR